MVERGGLENRCACKRTVGSNPTPTATGAGLKKSQWFYITIINDRVITETLGTVSPHVHNLEELKWSLLKMYNPILI